MQAFKIQSNAAELLGQARRSTGIEIIDTEIAEALEVAVHSLNTEAQLSKQGAADMERRLLRLLCNRLRMLRDFERHPEIMDQKIVRPVFLTGGPRTGSTKLHKLLAASEDFLYLPFWQAHTLSLRTGNRGEDPADRIREAIDYIDWVNEKAPQVKHIHGYGTFEPEEETLIYEHGLFGFFIACIANVPSFVGWYLSQDPHKITDFLVRALKYLQWQFYDGDTRPWVLKYPGHQGLETVLAACFPGAAFITTNRDPVALVPSACSLTLAYHGIYSDTDWRIPMGAGMLEAQKMRGLGQVRARDEHPELKILDIAYSDLIRRTDKVIEDIYRFLARPLTDPAKSAMLEWDKRNAPEKLGVHRYTLQEFGLTEDGVRAALQPYIARYGHCF